MPRSPLGFAVGACFSLAVLVSSDRGVAAQEQPALDVLLTRLSAYLADYEVKLSSLVAREHYEQEYQSTSLGRKLSSDRRQLDAEFLFLRLPGYDDWVGFRDVTAVDDVPLRPEAQRLVDRLAAGTAAAFAEARHVSEDNARFNIGDTPRTINVPTTTLNFLTARNRARMRFQRPVAEPVDGQPALRLDFTETGKPTIIRTREGADQRARGAVWITAETGAVVRTRLQLGDDDRAEDYVRTVIGVTYQMVPTLELLAPVEMYESYYRPVRGDAYTYRISAHAVYSNFRRFEVGSRLVP